MTPWKYLKDHLPIQKSEEQQKTHGFPLPRLFNLGVPLDRQIWWRPWRLHGLLNILRRRTPVTLKGILAASARDVSPGRPSKGGPKLWHAMAISMYTIVYLYHYHICIYTSCTPLGQPYIIRLGG